MPARTSFRMVDDKIVQMYEAEQYSANTTDVMEYIKKKLSTSTIDTNSITSTPPLPLGCRAYFKQGIYQKYLVELPPGKHPFNYSFYEDDDNEAVDGSPTVVMPWQYFLFSFTEAEQNNYGISANFDNVKLFWSDNRFVDWNSRVYTALLPNLSSDGTVCLGDAFPESTKTICERIETVVNEFYDHTFNNDLGRLTPYEDIDSWVYQSNRSLTSYLNWPKHGVYPFWEFLGIQPDRITNTDSGNLLNLLVNAIQNAGVGTW